MDNNPLNILKNIAEGSLKPVFERNNRLVLIDTDTVKVKNSVLKEYVEQALADGHSYEDICDVLLMVDKAVEENTVERTLKEYL